MTYYGFNPTRGWRDRKLDRLRKASDAGRVLLTRLECPLKSVCHRVDDSGRECEGRVDPLPSPTGTWIGSRSLCRS